MTTTMVVNQSQFKYKTDMTTGNLGVVIQSLSPSASKVVVALAEAKTDLKNIIIICIIDHNCHNQQVHHYHLWN